MKKLLLGLAIFIASLFFADQAFAYTVQDGDTMSEIARKHGMKLDELVVMNPQVENVDLIIVGQNIITEVIHDNAPKLFEGMHIEEKEEAVVATLEAVKTAKTEQVVTDVKSVSSKYKFSSQELDLLARIVRAEAQAEPFEGKVAVAAVVLNRLESPKFPDTIQGVIYQRGQFQPVRNGAINKPADEESKKAVHAALNEMRYIAKEALFFYNPAIATSRWLDSRTTAAKIGRHVFKY
ncbi:cell wall hydrolase [Bacillus sp. REN16]|uniref:cell wall hydrolase n=1 Tax=Bacillus sp. REN16 TaxID=2887296 RepID=UPI001E44C770|nr:cell wall hydrolase [Bacillus sp. REN16]MCC3357189.1 cell wall hydrolase [Bacillus sp. REN16]